MKKDYRNNFDSSIQHSTFWRQKRVFSLFLLNPSTTEDQETIQPVSLKEDDFFVLGKDLNNIFQE